MKLIVSAIDESTLQFELDDVFSPLKKSRSVNADDIKSLQVCCDSYQAVLNQPGNTDTLRTIGFQLYQIFHPHTSLMAQWLEVSGARQLEISTSPNPSDLQRLLLNLPWEVMARDNQFLAEEGQYYEVTRRIGVANPGAAEAQYKDLTLAFMAADPDFKSGLNYEAEEQAILKATRKTKNLNLWVDDSGNLDSLVQRISDSEHCDMVHLSCHGVHDEQRGIVLQLEDEAYGLQEVAAGDFGALARQISCLFLSACHSAEVTDTLPFAMQLAQVGIPNVIGWDGPVADDTASVFAAQVYHALMQQMPVPAACAAARKHLLEQHLETNKHSHWHLGRVYLNVEGGKPLTEKKKPTSPKRRGKSFHALLDTRKKVVPVASKETFVGRRKQTKQALKALDDQSIPGVLLTGIGGSGKSSLAARIVHRQEPAYKAAIIYQDYSEIAILGELKQFIPVAQRAEDYPRYLADIRENPEFFADNLVEILEEHLSDNPVILVVDDLEQHVLEALTDSSVEGKVVVKAHYQAPLFALIDAFERADTQSRLLLTSRHQFYLADDYGNDKTAGLQVIDVPDMNPTEQEKHWLALVQSGVVTENRDEARDSEFLEQIREVCLGNPGLQDVLYQPLLKGEFAVLEAVLVKLRAYHAGSAGDDPVTNVADVDKYLQRIALEDYYKALSNTERECLRVLSLFDFAVPEELLVQAEAKLGIGDARAAMQRLDDFGLLTHWQGEGVEGHISCYGLARKIVEPLGREDRHFIATVCAPLLWGIWFEAQVTEFLKENSGNSHYFGKSIIESLSYLAKEYPLRINGYHALPFKQYEFQRIGYFQKLCIENSEHHLEKLGASSEHFVDLLELSISLSIFEKLRISYACLGSLNEFQIKELIRILEEERSKWKPLIDQHASDFTKIVLEMFSGSHLLVRAYRLYSSDVKAEQLQIIESVTIANEEDKLIAAIKLAQKAERKAAAYSEYAKFLSDQKQDYVEAEVMYIRAVEADPNHANNLGNYANFLQNQKQDYVEAEAMYIRAVEADPNHAHWLGVFANFLQNQKQDYVEAEAMYIRAVEADPNHANNLGNYANFLKNQKQDYVEAEAMYIRAVEADPNNADILGNYAYFLENQKQDYVEAEVMYIRAVEADPNHANNLGNYALFLKNQKQDYVEAEVMYIRAVEAGPNDAHWLGAYATFLKNQKQDYVEAEAMYIRAVEADPNHAGILEDFAIFLQIYKQDCEQAKVMYSRAIDANPNNANCLGNYAQLLFSSQNPEALHHLEKAENQPDLDPDLKLELAFYRYAHCPPHNLTPVKQQLQSGSRSIDWNLSANVKRATEDHHPHPELLAAIAQVISGEQPIETLNTHPEWTQNS
uniref:AAA ATPase domain-containing protein n=1 Tax=uncultured Thiotrichaceae bacterium TaxID=298394 RepID=A0A6S6UEX5_9GAMM